MINPSDVYTGYGFSKLYGCWTAPVTKFDSSSFYNWEQDNLPVLDLEERTSLLWERLGHPTSSIDGIALVVSGDASDSCDSNIFKTLSSCLATLPEVINCPYLIEVASYGNIGSLILSNKTFGPRGSIEIINRNFSKIHSSFQTSAGDIYTLNSEKFGSDTYSQEKGIASSVYIPNSLINSNFSVNSTDGSSAPCIPTDFKLSKVLSLNSVVTSSTTYDSRITGNLTLFTKQYLNGTNRLTAALAATNDLQPFTTYVGQDGASTTSGLTAFKPYDLYPASPDSTYVGSYDASNINNYSDDQIEWNFINTSGPATTLAYTNRLNQIKIYNCNGPIYIRNFTVDGGSYGGRDYGIDINNSTVVIESCSVARANKAGLHAENSKVILTRGFVAYRNYGFNESGVRIGLPWTTKLLFDNYYTDQKFYSAGIELINSELNFSSTFARDLAYGASAIKHFYKFSPLTASAYEAYSWLFCTSKNDVGIKAINSIILGGRNQKNDKYGLTVLDEDYHHSNLICELNTEAGILLENSQIDYSGRLAILANYIGIKSNNSNLVLDQLVCKNNQREGVLLNNSYLRYNKDCYVPDTTFFTNTYDLGQLAFFRNQTHIKLINSVFEPTDTYSMPTRYHQSYFGDANAAFVKSLGSQRLMLPNIVVDSNSKLRLVSPTINTQPILGYALHDVKCTVNGHAISVTNNSELTLQGTGNYITKIIGSNLSNDPADGFFQQELYDIQKNKSGLFAGNNSTVKIQGPTLIAQFGVDLLADNNSNIELTPHKDKNNRYEVDKFNLSSGLNHTIVELHSSRSCVVVNNNSNFIAKDLGSYENIWRRSSTGTNIIDGSGIPIVEKEIFDNIYGNFTASGALQFYPNPNSYNAYSELESNILSDLNTTSVYTSPITPTINSNVSAGYILSVGANYGTPENSYLFSSVTNGGMCVRALGGSKVDIDNVHFPCGWWVPSALIYEASGPEGLCCKTFLWNIADTSQLNARLVSVSGMYPSETAYVGPLGTWGNASGAPADTPDTGSVSILDYYGSAAGNHRYASNSYQNRGPFRLYFSIDPAINNADGIATTGLIGYLPQVYSQGYQFSGNLNFSGLGTTYYKSILYPSGTNSSVASGFYYASSIVSNPKLINATLDDSAANLFANAKHNTVGKSGLATKVAINFPYNLYFGGESAEEPEKNRGDGFKSPNTFDLNKDN